jgi:NADH:ubiquinone oxidoreductase subunit B-like Fe-S oxidoreductase
VTNRYDYDRFGLLVKDHTPVADTEPRTRLTFQLLDVAMPGCCKGIEFLTDALPDLRRKLSAIGALLPR